MFVQLWKLSAIPGRTNAFTQLILAFYLLGMLMDQDITNYERKKNYFYGIVIAFVVCIIKSFFGMPSPPFYYNNSVKVVMSIICAIIEVLVIIALMICVSKIK